MTILHRNTVQEAALYQVTLFVFLAKYCLLWVASVPWVVQGRDFPNPTWRHQRFRFGSSARKACFIFLYLHGLESAAKSWLSYCTLQSKEPLENALLGIDNSPRHTLLSEICPFPVSPRLFNVTPYPSGKHWLGRSSGVGREKRGWKSHLPPTPVDLLP